MPSKTAHLDQGVGGAKSTKKTGDHLDPTGSEGGARRGKSGNKFDQNPNVKTRVSSGSHLDPVRSHVAGPRTPERGGHSRTGHGNFNPSAAKSKSGSHLDQHPSLKK